MCIHRFGREGSQNTDITPLDFYIGHAQSIATTTQQESRRTVFVFIRSETQAGGFAWMSSATPRASAHPRGRSGQAWQQVKEHAGEHRDFFGPELDAVMGGVVAGVAGSKGGRVAVLLATVDTDHAADTSSQNEQVKRYCIMPVAMRMCGGQSIGDQHFLAELNLNCRITEGMRTAIS